MNDTIETTEQKKDKGFTLIELLIVIVILGILATVTVFAVSGITERGQENACSVDRRTMETAAEAYYAENDEYAPNEAALSPDFIREDSDLHNYAAVGTPPTGYTITAVAPCT